MKRLTVIAFALALSSGCVGRYYGHAHGHAHNTYAAYPTAPAQVVVAQPPPPLPMTTELRTAQPSGSSTWVEGHWSYNGMWVWVDGTWVSGYTGWVWTAPAIVIVDGTYVLHRGYFRQPAQQPAPAYTHRHRIPISVGAHIAGNGHYRSHDQAPTHDEPAPGPVDETRILAVPGAVVRTPPEPTVTATTTPGVVLSTPPSVNSAPVTERPVLVAPGARVIRHPAQPATPPTEHPSAPADPAAPAPVLTNVEPVIDRPVPSRATPPVKVPGRVSTPTPVPQPASQPMEEPGSRAPANIPSKTPSHDAVAPSVPTQRPSHVAPSGNATRAPHRAPVQSNSNHAAAEATTAERRGKPAAATRVRPSAGATRSTGRSRKDPDAKPSEKPAAAITCSLSPAEAPRGGQLDVHGEGFGATPVVRIGGKVTRILRRNATDIRVQIPRDSNGGSVTVHAGGATGECGSLTIIGTDR